MTPTDEVEPVSPYSGRWIARIGQAIISQGGSPEQVFKAAKAVRAKETILISYIPLNRVMTFHPIFLQVQQILSGVPGIYLVGGAVRDALLGRRAGDLDFAVQNATEKVARRVSAALGSDFYILDKERESFRLIIHISDGKPLYLDFNKMRGTVIDADLAARDFTINAMAVDIHDPQKLIDPLGGAQDLKDRILKACSPASIQDDPVRVIRAARMACDLQLKLDTSTLAQIKVHHLQLANITAERRRDEFFKGLETQPAKFLRLLFNLQVGENISPMLDLPNEKREEWLVRVRTLDRLLALMQSGQTDREENLWSGLLLNELSGYRTRIGGLSNARIQQDRPRSTLWVLACLGWGTSPEFDLGQLGADLVLTNSERQALDSILGCRDWLAKNVAGVESSDQRIIHRYFSYAGEYGIDAAILYLANAFIGNDGLTVGTFPMPSLRVAVKLMHAWWYERESVVDPPVLLDGYDIQRLLNIHPGQIIGELLAKLREEQAAGLVVNEEQAKEFVIKQYQ